MSTLLIASRKGLFTAKRSSVDAKWQITGHYFHGEPVTQVLADPRDGTWYAALRLGHFGVKMRRSSDRGRSWDEIPAPAFPPKPTDGEWADDATPWTVDLVWSIAAGGAHERKTLWAGCMPAGVFRSQDGGDSWQLVDSLWLDARRKGWFGGGNDHPGLHSICVDPTNSQRVTIAISCGGVWRTEDAGKTWSLYGAGMQAPYMPPELAADQNTQDVHSLSMCVAQPEVMWVQHHAGA